MICAGGESNAGRIFDVVADIAEFADRCVFQAFAPPVEVLVDLQGCFLHYGVRLLAPAAKQEVFSPREPGVTILAIKGQPQQGGRLAMFVGGSHVGLST